MVAKDALVEMVSDLSAGAAALVLSAGCLIQYLGVVARRSSAHGHQLIRHATSSSAREEAGCFSLI